MATDAKDLIRSALFHSLRTSYRSVRDHPSLTGALLSLLLLYTTFPSLFAFLLSSSPVIAITTLLLGLLLSHGHPDTHPTFSAAALKAPTTPADDLIVATTAETRVVESHAQTSSSSSSVSSSSSDVEEENLPLLENILQRETEFSPFTESLVVKIDNKQENFFDSSLRSPWQPVDVDAAAADSSSSGSDRAESSSPDASMADIAPLLDELHPFLDQARRPLLVDSWDDQAASAESSGGSEDGDKEEHQDEKGVKWESSGGSEDGDKEEQQGDKGVKWTADDQRNVMDLGISDMERNRRLENLIARRRARRDLRFVTERNLIDLDFVSGVDELSRFQVRIPPISAKRRNPFDLPYGSEGPGSAPSAMLRRRNPFDLPLDRAGLSGSLTTEDLVSREDMFLGMHDDFSWRAAFSDGIEQERSEAVESEESGPLIVDQEQHVGVVEREFNQETELLLSPHDTYHVGQECSSSLGAASVDTSISTGEIQGIDSNAAVGVEAVSLVDDAFRAMEEEIREDAVNSSVMNAAKLEVEEESKSSLGGYDKNFESKHEELVDATRDDSSKDCSNTIQPHPAYFSFTSRLEAGADEVQVEDPVYDLSPSGSTISLLDEPLLDAGRGGGLISPLLSHIHRVVSETASTPKAIEKNILPDVESESVKVTLSNLSSLDKDSETTEIGEHGIIQDQLLIDHEDSYQPIPHVIPMSEAVMESSGLSTIETESSALIDVAASIDVATTITLEDNEKIGALNLDSHAYVFRDPAMTTESPVAYKATEKPEMHPSKEARFDESHVRFPNLAPIPEENVDDFKPNEENEGRMNTPRVIGVTDPQMIEEPLIEFAEIDKELSLFQTMSTEGTMDAENTSRQVLEIVNNDASIISPVVSVTDLGGESLHEPTKSTEYTRQLDTNSEHESLSSPNNSQGLIINNIQGAQEGEFPDMLTNLDDRPNEINAEVGTVEEIKEDLLSELDVIGDFNAELKSDHGDHQEKTQYGRLDDNISSPLIYDEEKDIFAQLQFPEARSTGVNLTSSDEFFRLMDQSEVMEQVGSSSQSYDIDAEMIVYKPQLHVLEACSLEELDTAFKKLREEALMSSGSERMLEQSLAAATELGSNIFDVDDPNLTEPDSKLHILEASSLEELQSVFKQLHEEALLSSGSEPTERSIMAETEIGLANTVGDPKVIEADSELQDLEASSFQELDSVYKQLHGGAAPPDSKLIADISETSETEGGSNKFEIAGGEHKQSDENFVLQVLEANSIEDINFAFNKHIERVSEKSVIPEVEPSQEFVDDKNLVSMGVDPDLRLLEVKSREDIQLALKHITDVSADLPMNLMEPEGSSVVAEATERHLEPEILVGQSEEKVHLASVEDASREPITVGSADLPMNLMEPEGSSVVAEATERHLEPEILVGQSEEKVHLASVEDASMEPGLGDGQNDEKLTGDVKVGDIPSSDASNSRKTRKKDKSGKPASSSSSSSSDSD